MNNTFENEKEDKKHSQACKSRAEGERFTSFFRVLPTSHVGYHAGKSRESVVY